MEKLNSDPQKLHNLEKPQSVEVDTNHEVEGTKTLKIIEKQTQNNSLWQNLDKTYGKAHSNVLFILSEIHKAQKLFIHIAKFLTH